IDQQVKVRGYRIEPGEVEAALLGQPSVREAVAIVREDVPGDRRIVAYVVGEGADATELREALRARLPEYMVPSAIVVMEAIPLTANGKVDRRALPAPEYAGEAYVAPRTPAEEMVAGIWSDVLGVERVGAADDFFALGGHSLLATRVISRVREAFGTEVPLRTLFEAPTVAGLAQRVEALRREAGGVAVPAIVPVPRDGALPLSFAQERLWFLDQLEPGRSTYNIPFALRMRGVMDVAALERSLTALVARHESLRTRFETVGDAPVQVIDAAAPFAVPVVEVGESQVAELAEEEARTPFDLRRGPLLRAKVLRIASDEHVVLFTMHHIVSDGWSMEVLVREVSALYDACVRGEALALAPLAVQYADYAAWQRSWFSGDVLESQLGYWRERLAGAPPVLELPTDRPRSAVLGDAGATHSFILSAETSRALRLLGQREGSTLFMVLLAGYQALLSRYSGQDDVLVGTPIAGRTRGETEGLIGFFVNTLVLRTDLSGAPSFREVVHRVREATLGAFTHQDLPFERLVDELKVERSLRHTPLFQALFALTNAGREELELSEVQTTSVEREGPDSVKFDLMLAMVDQGDRLAGSLTYRAELFDAATIERMAAHLVALLDGAAAAPALSLAEIEVLSASEVARLTGWSGEAREYPRERSIQSLFAEQAARTPDAAAVDLGGGRLTYAELDRASNRLAHHLRALGVGAESRVGVALDRGAELIVTLLGILKAGGAYVSLDAGYPADRLAFMVEDAGVGVLV
ncbi:MAG: condensation domain-containing protein, partial [Trueperaceae bacterium]